MQWSELNSPYFLLFHAEIHKGKKYLTIRYLTHQTIILGIIDEYQFGIEHELMLYL